MYPELFNLGPFTIYTYGLLVATGFLVGISLTVHLAQKEGMDPQHVYDTSFWIVIGAIIGSRVLFVIVNWENYVQHPVDILKIWTGGLVFYGGLAGAAVAAILCARKYKLDFWAFSDVVAPGVALGHSIGRWGCFAAGCCYGVETSVPWSVTFTDSKAIAPTGVPLHPAQLYDSANELIIFAILMLIVRPHKRFKGQVWWSWVALYAVGRFIVEVYRGDPRGVYFGGMISTSQIVAVVALTWAVIVYVKNLRKPVGA